MKMRCKNALVGQSGGPTAAINASLAGVIAEWLKGAGGTLYGMANGITGILDERLYDLSDIFGGNAEALSELKLTPAAALGSCRMKLPRSAEDPVFYEKLFSLFKKYEIGYFFYIGGNDSMDTVLKLSEYADTVGSDIRFVGIPKTVDNDLVGTDHTPGFGSAAKYVASVCAETKRDVSVYTQPSVTVIEIMGRDAGWLTASSALASTRYSEGPELIYLPETPFSLEKCFSDIEDRFKHESNLLIAVSEGIRDASGNYVSADRAKTDNFGHAMLCGAASALKERIKEHFGCKVRAIELNTVQRSAGHSLSLTDISESYGVGAFGVREALSGKSGMMAAISRVSDDPYRTEFASLDIHAAANKVKPVPREFISEDGSYVTEAALRYLRPLILGECALGYFDGVPKHFVFKGLK